MSNVLQVKPGTPQRIYGGGKVDSLIFANRDTTNAVWIGNGSVAPEVGMYLPPLANISWTETGPIYACVDTGVTDPVSIFMSDEIDSFDDPVSTAIATVTQILESGGIPVPPQFDRLYRQNGITGAYTSDVFDLEIYKSMLVSLFSGTSPVPFINCDISWFMSSTAASNELIDSDSFTYSGATIGNPTTTLRIPLRARYCRITCSPLTTPVSYNFTVYGSSIETPYTLLRSRLNTATVNGSAAYPLLLRGFASVPGNGGSFKYYIPPVAQTIRLVFGESQADTNTFIAYLSAMPRGDTVAEYRIASIQNRTIGAGINAQAFSVPFGVPMSLEVFNNTTVARAPTLSVWDTSNM